MPREFDFGRAVDRMKELAELSYVPAVERLRGRAGVEALFALLAKVRQVLQHVPFEAMTEGLYVQYRLDDEQPESQGGHVFYDPSELAGYALSGLTIEVSGTETLRMWPTISVSAPIEFPGITYKYVHAGRETIHLDGHEWALPTNAWPCSLGVPTYSRLEDALARYVELNRRPEYCAHINEAWRDDKRLAFAPKPEKHLRRSLFLALRYSLEGAVVRQEQNQDESKPVDIEVTWWSPGRSAIVEVKWMGDSGPVGRDTWSTSYGHERARQGLQQLADYLDRRHGATPNTPVLGYIFVFDAMRDGVEPTSTAVSRENGLRYQHEDVDYQADLLARADIGRPYRCFLEPILG